MNPILKIISKVHVALYQMSGGRLGGTMGGQEILLLHHVGAKSGKQYTTPLGFVRDGDAYVIIAAAAGQPTHPGWYHNLNKQPNISVNIAGKQINVIAEVAPQAQRDKLWLEIAAKFPQLTEFQKKTQRVIPVVLLRPQFV